MVYYSAFASRRILWVSLAYARSSPQMCAVLRAAVGRSEKVNLLGTKAEFLEGSRRRHVGPRHHHRPMEVLALVTQEERDADKA